jgi:hypothetical protein
MLKICFKPLNFVTLTRVLAGKCHLIKNIFLLLLYEVQQQKQQQSLI